MSPHTRSQLLAIPKVNLHCHLAGSVQPETLVSLARAQGLDTPKDVAGAQAMVCVHTDSPRSLAYALQAIAATYPVLQTAHALERAAFEAAAANARIGVAYLELRGGPQLHMRGGLALDDVIAAIVAGLRRAEDEFVIRTGFIPCVIRGSDVEDAFELVDTAIRFATRGVVGIDIAGDERRFPATPYLPACRRARDAGLGVTVHAGEDGGADNVREAVVTLHAQRIGHGVAAVTDADCIALLKERRVTLELCPTSNVRTGAVRSFSAHPALTLLRAGIRISVADDDPATFSTDVVDELAHLVDVGMTLDEVRDVQQHGIDAAFCSPAARRELSTALQQAAPR